MKKFMLIPDLESLNLEEETPEFEEIEVPEDIDAAMVLVMEADEEVVEEFAEMDNDDAVVEETESAIERLENLAEVIREYGISGPMMKAADPYRELVEAGLCKSYEELGLEFIKDDESEAVATALDNTIASTEAAGYTVLESKIGKRISDAASLGVTAAGVKYYEAKDAAKKAGASAANKAKAVGASAVSLAKANPKIAAGIAIGVAAIALTALTVKLAKSMATHKAALKSVQKKLSEAGEFEDEKFKVVTKKVLSKDEFGKAVKGADLIIKVATADNFTKVAADIENALTSGLTEDKLKGIAAKAGASLKSLNTPDIKAIFGLEISESDDGIGVIKSSATVSKSSGNLGEKGWSAKDAKPAVEAAIRITSEGEALAKAVKSAGANLNKVAGSLKKGAIAEGVDKAVVNAAIAKIKKLSSISKTLVKYAVNSVYKVNGTAVQVAKVAISAQKKG